jgi:oligoendopeptidase F
LLFSSTLGGKSAVPKRSEIADRYKWNLTDIYPDWKAWEASKGRAEILSKVDSLLGGKTEYGIYFHG